MYCKDYMFEILKERI